MKRAAVWMLLACCLTVSAQTGARNGEWRTYGADLGNTHYSSLDQIKAARPTRDYDPGYVTPASFVKADQFVEAVYRGLTKR